MGVFTSLFGSRKKSFSFDCPMCTRTYDVKFNIEDAAECGFYEHSNYYRHVNDAKCEFCKTEMAIVYARDGRKVKAFDEKWQKVERKYNANSEKVQEALDDIEAKIDDEGSTPAREKKKVQLEARMEKLDHTFESKECKYADRQCNWQEKWEDKLERMGR